MQHVSTYDSHLQANLRTVIALQVGCAHFGSNITYSAFIHNVNLIFKANKKRGSPPPPNGELQKQKNNGNK